MSETVRCMICGAELEWVTGHHLRTQHGISTEDYKRMFPGVSTYSPSLGRKVSKGLLGHECTEDTKQKISEATTGQTRSEEVREQMSRSATGRVASSETRSRMSTSMIELWKDPEYLAKMKKRLGRPSSEETNQKIAHSLQTAISEAYKNDPTYSKRVSKGVTATMLRKWQDPEFVQCWSEGMSKAMSRVSQGPNNSEQQLQSILDSHFPGEWEYVGDGKVWFGGRNPDFINVNSKKQVIEMFGVYWHDTDLFPDRPTEEELTVHYKKYGIDCLIFWEYDIWDEENVVARVKELMR